MYNVNLCFSIFLFSSVGKNGCYRGEPLYRVVLFGFINTMCDNT